MRFSLEKENTTHLPFLRYHDEEWGRKNNHTEQQLYERLVLEGFQSGLSWLTILRKRENFRKAFAGFDIAKVAAFGAQDVERLVEDAGIIRHRGKIEAAIANAKGLQQLAAEGLSLHDLLKVRYCSLQYVLSLSQLPWRNHFIRRGFADFSGGTNHAFRNTSRRITPQEPQPWRSYLRRLTRVKRFRSFC